MSQFWTWQCREMSATQYAGVGWTNGYTGANPSTANAPNPGHNWFAKAPAGVALYADPLQNKDFPVSAAGNDRCSGLTVGLPFPEGRKPKGDFRAAGSERL